MKTPPSPSAETARENVQNALSLASIAAQQGDLSVQFGPNWCFNWRSRVIEIPEHDLLSKPWQHNAWIVLHEAAHVAITRYQWLVSTHQLQQPGLLLLLNALEDIRIERWLVERFPGTVPWQQISYADAETRPCPPPARTNPVNAFIEAAYLMGMGLPLPDGIHPKGLAAALTVRDAVERLGNTRPPTEVATSATLREMRHRVKPLSVIESVRLQTIIPESLLDEISLLSQLEAFRIVQKEILPTYRKLIHSHGEATTEGQGSLALSHIHPTATAPQSLSIHTSPPPPHNTSQPHHHAAYHDIVSLHHPHIEHTCNVILDNMRLNRSLKQVVNQPHGDRVHMPSVLQFSADRRKHNTLWSRRIRPTTPDPAFLFVIDVSHSMQQENRAQHTMESMVILREACLRIKIPHAILTFASNPSLVVDWTDPDSSRCQDNILSIANPSGGTNFLDALHSAQTLITQRPEKDRHLWILTDGEVNSSHIAHCRTTLRQLRRQNVRIHGLGFGAEARNLKTLIPSALLNVTPETLKEIVRDFLLTASTHAA